ncbi:TadE/TadG family type IV pilus assembly protein [Beijerinckia sp. L45]|uniref:TadE/TadG family type IV pilus assembly protein n=1 Tax=Beijerinckia sp. L45 TaxID=1641855 RepID=UPI00131CE672|nr:TadE/TadG family type IV pilus assembly protein [Beijerinckia sp. L45]
MAAAKLNKLTAVSAIAFARDRSGATAVEFGLIALPFLATIVFLISIGYMVYVKQGLDFATQKAARQIRIGAVQQAQLTQTQFVTQLICPALPMTVNCNNLIVNVSNVPYTAGNANNYQSYMTFVNAQQTNLIIPALTNTGATYCPGQGGKTPSYVYLQVLYPVPRFMSLFASSATTVYNGQKVFLVMATATFLNEPFVAPTSAC